MHRLALRSVQLTAAMLVASVALIGPGVAGLGASLPLGLLLLVLASILFAGREEIAAVGHVGWVPLGPMLRMAWVGIVIAAAVVLLAGGASPGEMQAYGGLCGLLGMLNYFLRPIYGLVYAAGRYVNRAVGGSRRP